MDETWLSAALLLWQDWLSDRQQALDPAAWDTLRIESEKLRQKIETAVLRGRTTEAETALLTFSHRHGIRALLDLPRPRDLTDPLLGLTRGPDSQNPFESTRGSNPRALSAVLQGIGRLLTRSPPPSPIRTYPEVRIPDEVHERTAFTVQVAARPTSTPHTGSLMTFARPANGRVDLDVTVELPDEGIEPRSPLEQPLRIHADGSSATIVFDVFATSPGAPRVDVIFRRDGVEQTRVTRNIHVLPQSIALAPEAARAPISAGPVTSGPPFGGLVLRFDQTHVTAEHRLMRLTLNGPAHSGVPHYRPVTLPIDVRRTLVELSRDIVGARPTDPVAAETSLENIGASLTTSLLGPEIARDLASYPEGTPLHIESEDAWVPWELLFVELPGQRGFFLGEHFAVTRWLHTGHMQDDIHLDRAVLIAPPWSDLSPDDERDALDRFFSRPPMELSELAEVQSLLRATPRTAVHFVCHGTALPDSVFPEALTLADNQVLRTIDIRAAFPREPGALHGSLVFPNACQAGIPVPTIWGSGGWAEACLKAGAAAFLAPSWSVGDRLAAVFAETFYRHARRGTLLSEAARLARIAAREPGSVFRLGYALYSSPSARIVVGNTAAGRKTP